MKAGLYTDILAELLYKPFIYPDNDAVVAIKKASAMTTSIWPEHFWKPLGWAEVEAPLEQSKD